VAGAEADTDWSGENGGKSVTDGTCEPKSTKSSKGSLLPVAGAGQEGGSEDKAATEVEEAEEEEAETVVAVESNEPKSPKSNDISLLVNQLQAGRSGVDQGRRSRGRSGVDQGRISPWQDTVTGVDPQIGGQI